MPYPIKRFAIVIYGPEHATRYKEVLHKVNLAHHVFSRLTGTLERQVPLRKLGLKCAIEEVPLMQADEMLTELQDKLDQLDPEDREFVTHLLKAGNSLFLSQANAQKLETVYEKYAEA